jgi:predicted DNA-binding protein with PD1-like motif
MRATMLDANGGKTYAVVFDKGDEVVGGLTGLAKREGWAGSHLTAIGAFSAVTLGYFDRERRDYVKIPVREQVEVLSMIGDIALDDGQPKLHAHVVVGLRDGTTRGGHLLEAHVWPTLEVIVTESPRQLRRTTDRETGLALIRV